MKVRFDNFPKDSGGNVQLDVMTAELKPYIPSQYQQSFVAWKEITLQTTSTATFATYTMWAWSGWQDYSGEVLEFEAPQPEREQSSEGESVVDVEPVLLFQLWHDVDRTKMLDFLYVRYMDVDSIGSNALQWSEVRKIITAMGVRFGISSDDLAQAMDADETKETDTVSFEEWYVAPLLVVVD